MRKKSAGGIRSRWIWRYNDNEVKTDKGFPDGFWVWVWRSVDLNGHLGAIFVSCYFSRFDVAKKAYLFRKVSVLTRTIPPINDVYSYSVPFFDDKRSNVTSADLIVFLGARAGQGRSGRPRSLYRWFERTLILFCAWWSMPSRGGWAMSDHGEPEETSLRCGSRS